MRIALSFVITALLVAACASDGGDPGDPAPSTPTADGGAGDRLPGAPDATAAPDGAGTEPTDTVVDVDSSLDSDATPSDAPPPAELPGGSDGDSAGPDADPAVGDGGVGQPCVKDDHCTGDAVCVDWTGGYCSLLNCPTVTDCPPGSSCVDLGDGATLCLDQCTASADCRPGYGCKPFTAFDGTAMSGCVAVDGGAVGAGGPCQDHQDCEGANACLDFVPQGYCAVLGCGAELACPDGTACVTYNGQPTCLLRCTQAADCLVDGATERLCGPLLGAAGGVEKVCVPSVQGEGVGSECATDIECVSNQCRLVAKGKCVGSPLGCFEDTDCPGASVCELAPAYVRGICTQACTPGIKCPGTSSCVRTSGGTSWCQLPCKGATDTASCEAALGQVCVFGDPVADSTGNGKYVCAVPKPGDAGAACGPDQLCKDDADCVGTCAPACGLDDPCPFPTTCVIHAGALRCMRRCFSVLDCPGTMACMSTPESPSKICVP